MYLSLISFAKTLYLHAWLHQQGLEGPLILNGCYSTWHKFMPQLYKKKWKLSLQSNVLAVYQNKPSLSKFLQENTLMQRLEQGSLTSPNSIALVLLFSSYQHLFLSWQNRKILQFKSFPVQKETFSHCSANTHPFPSVVMLLLRTLKKSCIHPLWSALIFLKVARINVFFIVYYTCSDF